MMSSKCICGTETTKSFTGIAGSGTEFDYCPSCKEGAAFIAPNPDKMRQVPGEVPAGKVR